MSVTRPRGPLPARVYWVRRVMVLAVVFGLVFGISRLLGGSDGPEGPAATPAAAVGSASTSPSPTATDTATAGAQPVTGPTAAPTPAKKKKKKNGQVRVPLAAPTGPCRDRDVRVVPAMRDNAYAGGDVRLTLELSTFESPACNWEVSADSLAVRLTSGSDRIWTSQQCPNAVPDTAVVLRKRRPVLVDVTWSGRRSDAGCSRNTLWAEPGWYHLAAAAMGSEPESQQFELHSPAPVTITPSPTARPKSSAKPGRNGQDGKKKQGND